MQNVINVLFVIAVIIIWALYDLYTHRKKLELNSKKEAERKVELEKNYATYKEKQNIAVIQKKSDQKRPDDWSLRKGYVLSRDGHKCVMCGSSQNLHVHHKTPVSIAPDHSEHNLVTLCIRCHEKEGGPGHHSLVAMKSGSQCNKYFFKQVKCRKTYSCDCCGDELCPGLSSYTKSFWWSKTVTRNNKKIPDKNIRICEDCLLSYNDYTDRQMMNS